MTRTVLYSRARRPSGRPEPAAEPSLDAARAVPAPPTFPTRLRTWAVQRERALLAGGGVIAALAALAVYTLLTPRLPALTQKDIDAAVEETLKSRSPDPFHAVVATEAIRPSVVLVRRLGEEQDDADVGADRPAPKPPTPLKNPGKLPHHKPSPGAAAAAKSGSAAESQNAGGPHATDKAPNEQAPGDKPDDKSPGNPDKSFADKDHPEKEHATGLGTGVVISEEGLILTALHVVSGAKRIGVTFADGTESEAEVVSVQPHNDLAVLKAKTLPDDLAPATLRSTKDLKVGDEVIAVGYPFGIGPSTTYGVVSGLRREHESPDGRHHMVDLIQFDAAANPGNSGGPLVTAEGDVVGIVTAIFNPTDKGFFVGIAFAVPIENAASAAGLSPF